MTDDFMQEIVKLSVDDIRITLDLENQFIREEHNLQDKVIAVQQIVMHLEETIPLGTEKLKDFLVDIANILTDITDYLELEIAKEVRIVNEERDIFAKIDKDFRHNDWRAVAKDFEKEKKDEEKLIRLHVDEIRKLHSYFLNLMKLMKDSQLVMSIHSDDLTVDKQKEQYENEIDYYFIQIYKFTRAYERILRNLVSKEIHLYDKLKKDSRSK